MKIVKRILGTMGLIIVIVIISIPVTFFGLNVIDKRAPKWVNKIFDKINEWVR